MRLCAVAYVISVVLAVATACGDGRNVPSQLIDGSNAEAPAVELEGVKAPAVMTGVRVRDVARMSRGAPEWSCLRRDPGRPRSGELVERVGVTGKTVTFPSRSGRGVYGCDSTTRPAAKSAWCGDAFGILHGGRLRDARLDLACSAPDGAPVGFVWLQPGKRTRYVAVAQSGYTEVYAAADRVPIRAATVVGVDTSNASASFVVSEYDRVGHLLERHRLDAVVSG